MHWEVLWGEGGSRRFWKVPEVLPCPTRVEEYGLRESGRTKGGKPHEAVSPEERKRRREADSGGRYFNFPSHHLNLLKMARNNFPLSWENALPVRALSSDLPADWSCEEHRVGGEPAAMLQCPHLVRLGAKLSVFSHTICMFASTQPSYVGHIGIRACLEAAPAAWWWAWGVEVGAGPSYSTHLLAGERRCWTLPPGFVALLADSRLTVSAVWKLQVAVGINLYQTKSVIASFLHDSCACGKNLSLYKQPSLTAHSPCF